MTETKTANLDEFETNMAEYLFRSGMPAILEFLREEIRNGNGPKLAGADVATVAENIYGRMGRGDMGRGDVKRAIGVALLDVQENAQAEKEETAETFARGNLIAYEGDIDAANHGGAFFNLNRNHRENGYIECLRICRLDDAPFSSLILIESLTLLPDAPGSEMWNACADCVGLSREEYDAADETTKLWMDASICLAYGRYDPAEMGYQHHTSAVLTERLDDDAMDTLETGSLRPDVIAVRLDDDGDDEFDEPMFWRTVQERADATFTDLTSEDNIAPNARDFQACK